MKETSELGHNSVWVNALRSINEFVIFTCLHTRTPAIAKYEMKQKIRESNKNTLGIICS